MINGFHNSFYFPRRDGEALAMVRFQSPDDPPAMTVVENGYREFERE